jgi:hypothetical protein
VTLGSLRNPHEVHAAEAGSCAHAVVPFGAVLPPRVTSRCAPAMPTEAGKTTFMNAHPWPPRL